jgi:hypothetical protein
LRDKFPIKFRAIVDSVILYMAMMKIYRLKSSERERMRQGAEQDNEMEPKNRIMLRGQTTKAIILAENSNKFFR